MALIEQHRAEAENPDWPEFDAAEFHMHDWRKYVSPAVRAHWDALGIEARSAVIDVGKHEAAGERWD